MKLPEEIQFIANSLKTQKTTQATLHGKLCIITGATSGVGYQAALRLAKAGASLVFVVRDAHKAANVSAKLKATYGTNVEIVLADFSRLDEVRTAADTILEKFSKIDVLINNIGIHRTHRELTPEGFEAAFGVNHLASFLFTRLLLERLLASSPARIIQINSEGHRFGGLDLDDLNWERRRYRGLQGYGASKTAQLLTVWEMADLLEGTGVTINAMHPGAVRTNIGMDNGKLYQWWQRYLLFPLLRDPEISGEAIYYLAAAPEIAKVNGTFFNLTIKEKPMAHALDRALGKRVWEISEEMTALPKMALKP